ncbi:hypothetical protein BDQ17DRAFT_1331435 [Cyathus striatus]|nr:hypothetical protein BDQ17DRAFT_1331435 [Cyathus striatus]
MQEEHEEINMKAQTIVHKFTEGRGNSLSYGGKFRIKTSLNEEWLVKWRFGIEDLGRVNGMNENLREAWGNGMAIGKANCSIQWLLVTCNTDELEFLMCNCSVQGDVEMSVLEGTSGRGNTQERTYGCSRALDGDPEWYQDYVNDNSLTWYWGHYGWCKEGTDMSIVVHSGFYFSV